LIDETEQRGLGNDQEIVVSEEEKTEVALTAEKIDAVAVEDSQAKKCFQRVVCLCKKTKKSEPDDSA